MVSEGARGSTILLDRAGAGSAPAVPADQHRNAGRSTAAYTLLSSITTALAILFRSGYSFGLHDQWVHSLRGIALADPDAFVGDWFARSVPQPHWLFDAITFFGTRLGILPGVYLAYWLAGIVVFAVASVWLVDHVLPGRRTLSLALGPLVVLGPQAVLGSTTPLLWFAIPHMLGGCLAFLAVAALLTARWRWAATAALAAAAFHVQHGANLAPVLVLAAVLCRQATRRDRVLLAGTAGVVVVGARFVAQWRGIQTAGDEWLTACREIIPYHCHAPIWSLTYLAGGVVVLALAVGFTWSARGNWRTVVPAVAVPAAGLLAGVVAERYQLGFAGRLAAETNIHRLVTIVEPMAALAILCLFARIPRAGRLRAALPAVCALAAWVAIFDGAGYGTVTAGATIAFLLTVALLTAGVLIPTGGIVHHPGWDRFRRPVVAAVATTLTLLLAVGVAGGVGHVGYDRSLGAVKAGLALRRLLPSGAVIAAPPEAVWLRALTQRAVIADCKATPFGKGEWREYWNRIDALGGMCRHGESGYRALQPAEVEALRARYGATHALLFADDPKIGYAQRHWRLVYEAPPSADGSVTEGLALFVLPRRT